MANVPSPFQVISNQFLRSAKRQGYQGAPANMTRGGFVLVLNRYLFVILQKAARCEANKRCLHCCISPSIILYNYAYTAGCKAALAKS